jgi:hypothetical protein
MKLLLLMIPILVLAACDPNKPIGEQRPDFSSMTPNQLCVVGMSLAAATAAILEAAETKGIDLLDKPVKIGGAVCAQIAAMGSPGTDM